MKKKELVQPADFKMYIEVIDTDFPFLFDQTYTPVVYSFMKYVHGGVVNSEPVDSILFSSLLHYQVSGLEINNAEAVVVVQADGKKAFYYIKKGGIKAAFDRVLSALQEKQ